MTTETSVMGVPEISCYSRHEIEGGVIIRHLVRQPGECDRQSVRLFRPTGPDPEARVACAC